MFGTNPLRKQDLKATLLRVQEIFSTIQGEGPHAGKPAVFIRLAGCNLRCTFCDTDFESNYNNELTVEQIMSRVAEVVDDKNISLVVITGGEPLLQNILPLLSILSNSHYQVQIETAGTIWIPGLEAYCDPHSEIFIPSFIVCSPKTGSVHPKIERYCNHWKYIVAADDWTEDGLPGKGTQSKLPISQILYRAKQGTIWVQPKDVLDPDEHQLNVEYAGMIAMKHGYRLSFQIHKAINLP